MKGSYNLLKRNFVLLLVFVLSLSTFILSVGDNKVSAATMKDVPGSAGWKYRVDKPHVDGVNNDWHVHVEKGKVQGAERIPEGKSHGKTLTSEGVPKTVQKNVKATSDYKKAVEKQKQIDKERAELNKISWTTILLSPVVYLTTIATIIGVTISTLVKHPSLVFG